MSGSNDVSVDDVLIDRAGPVGRITLNRPAVINALTHAMVVRIRRALDGWTTDPGVGAVLLTGAGERGLCAGGDLRAIHRDIHAGGTATLDLWRDEYALNAAIARYPKPIVAVMHGLVMGGGIGLSGHASRRLVTDGSVLAMPEVGIGLAPDVGGPWLLSRAPGELGTHVALSAARLGPGDAIALGLADRYVPADGIPALCEALTALPAGRDDAAGAVDAVIEGATRPGPASELSADRPWIDACYAADTVEEILSRLERSGEPRASAAAEEITRKAPTAVKVTLAALRRTRRLACLESELDQEFRVSTHCFAAPDLAEGIRAQVVDKDRDPRWSPAVLEQVTEDRVRGHFASLGAEELGLAEGLEGRLS